MLFLGLDDQKTETFINSLYLFGGIVLLIFGVFAALFLWVFIEMQRSKGKTKNDFHSTTQVSMNETGITIEKLGELSWHQVLSLELIPDCDNGLIVHTSTLGRLMFGANDDDLIPLINHYLEATRIENLHLSKTSEGSYHFKAVVFHWPRFFAWILAGYLAAIAIIYVALTADKEFFKTLTGLVVMVPFSTLLVWSIPFGKLSYFQSHRTKAFELIKTKLFDGNGSSIDLSSSRIHRQEKSGIGYSLKFLSIIPKTGNRLDLLLGESEIQVILDKLKLSEIDS